MTATPADTAPPVEDGEDLIVTIPASDPVLEDETTQQRAPALTAAAPVDEPAPPDVEEGLEELRKQVAERDRATQSLAEQNRRLRAEQSAAIQFAEEMRRRGMSAEESLIETQLHAAQTAAESAKRDYKSFMESGDFEKAAEAQEQIASAAADRRALERDKEMLASRKTAPPHHPQPVSIDTGDSIETAIATQYTPATQAWLRNHKNVFRSDGSLKRAAVDAHETALDEGLIPDSPQYFARLEELISPKPLAPAEPQVEVQRRASVAAPVVRSAPPASARPAADGSFRLTPKMRSLAEASGAPETISYSDWAKEYLRMVRNGEMQPIE